MVKDNDGMKLGVIGCGKMGRALLEGILKAGIVNATDVSVFDSYAPAADAMSEELSVTKADSNRKVVEQSEAVLLCVKPQGFLEMLEELGDTSERLLISIAAGIRIEAIESATAGRHRVIRVMPNTPALAGAGASAFSLGASATEKDAALAEALLGAVGYVCRVEENDLDAVTALSGSGPAYIFLMLEALIRGAEEEGLTPEIARDLAVHTVKGAAELVLQTGDSPERLRENVTSPNGTTFAALESLRADRFENIVEKALSAAAARSRELGGT